MPEAMLLLAVFVAASYTIRPVIDIPGRNVSTTSPTSRPCTVASSCAKCVKPAPPPMMAAISCWIIVEGFGGVFGFAAGAACGVARAVIV